jgi:hypothetical protein
MNVLTKKNITLMVVFLASSLLIAYAIGYWSASHSESYLRACDFASHNATLVEQIGPLRACRLSSCLSYNIRYQGPNGSAQFRLNLVGQKHEGELFVNLVTNDGEWQVQTAKLKLPSNTFVVIR